MRRPILIILCWCWWLAAASGQDIKKFGLPDTGDIHERKGYVLSYDGRLRGARWTLELLTHDNQRSRADRAAVTFHEDADVLPEARARLRDYADSGYDIGHLAPAADHAASLPELRDTFRLSNASPQRPGFNRGRWKELETAVRNLAARGDVTAVWVLTGPLWIPDGDVDTPELLDGFGGQPPNVVAVGHIGNDIRAAAVGALANFVDRATQLRKTRLSGM